MRVTFKFKLGCITGGRICPEYLLNLYMCVIYTSVKIAA